MKRQCTETASAVAAAIADQTEFYFLNCRYTACFFIGRMIRSHVRECIYIIHFAGCQRFCRWILHHITFVWIRFNQTFCGKRIGIAVLRIKAARIGFFAGADILKGRQHNAIVNTVRVFCFVYCTIDICQVFDTDAAFESLCHGNDTALSHSV